MHDVESKANPLTRWTYHGLFVGALVFAGAASLSGCKGKQVQAEGPSQPLEERRALQVIGKAVQDEGLVPVAGRTVEVMKGKSIEIDVAVDGQKYGIAYTGPNERAELGEALPQREYEGQLQLVKGYTEDEADTRILVLHASDYMLDDHLGTGYEESTITAERKLGRDVRDFLVEARENRWP